MNQTLIKKSTLAIAIMSALCGASNVAMAQSADDSANSDESAEVIEVTGIRSALASALNEKRNAANIKEIIKAEDIGKLPDNNLAEVLENITGVQINRTNGVGTGVQIRGTGANRVEINGISTVGSGSGRTGISFEDLPAALIASLEVTKAPTAKTVEGSVGGTINLRTLRGNSLKERLLQFRAQGENSDLADSTTPRFSATFGDNWETDFGKIGVVLTGSYAEQDVASANPRFDRDRIVTPDSGRGSAEDFPFLRTQFLDQPLNAENYETTNLTASFELQSSQSMKYYFDATINDQERVGTSSRAFFSGTGGNPVIDNTTNTGFETINLGSVDGRFGTLNLGEVQVVTSGILGVGSELVGGRDRIDPNLRTSNSNSSRLTTSRVFAFGGEYSGDKYELVAEIAYSDSETDNPALNSSLDFINPNGPQVGPNTFNDNGTPAIFAIANNTFEFGIAPGLPETPTAQQLLDPSNYALRSIGEGLRTREASEAAFRVDYTYDISDKGTIFTDINAGFRWNSTTNTTDNSSSNNSFGNWDRPRASLFSDIVTPGANNFNGADNRELFIADYLIIDNAVSFNDPEFVTETINNAIIANNALAGSDVNSLLSVPTTQISSFFDIKEKTSAFYVQGDYEIEVGEIIIGGNIGARYVSTDLTSNGTVEVGGVITPTSEQSNYQFLLPRLNIAAEVMDDLIVRVGVGKDIRRPDFDSLSTSANFGASASGTVSIGNPSLEPEQIWSYDLAMEYYFSPSSFVSIGLFHKERTDLITTIQDEPDEPIGPTGQIERDVTAPCEGGGIFNPNVPAENYNVFSSRTDTTGICVARSSQINAGGTETQSGVELAAQYDLAAFEDSLGWASGFGVIANYTYQESGAALDEFREASAPINQLLGRTDTNNSTPSLADDVVTERITLDNLSENSFNFTLFYDKHDINVRVRYTWRDAFTETLNRMRFNIPPVVGARGQLNMSASYAVNETFTVGIEGVNLTQEDRTRWCFNEDTLLCEQSLTDRRITLGVTGKF
ncbi:TonB-dependent receptor [Glaciecola sp. SC05]|uniref:TonB-dependent receptor n=1 Tax=Glaciecola sp. SC05 TaxID=1987355 RepID=UPI003526F838